MKRVVLIALLAVSVVMVLAVTGFSYAGMFLESGYLVPDVNLRGALLDRTGGSFDAIEVNEYDQIFTRGNALYIGTEDEKQKYSDEFPMYINGGAAVRFLNNSTALYNADFVSNKGYQGLAVNNGVSFNEDYTRSDYEEYILIKLSNGLFINSGYMYVDTFLETFSVPSNSILNPQEDCINYFSLENGVFVYHEIRGIEPGDTIRIGSAELAYSEFLRLLGLSAEKRINEAEKAPEEENETLVEPYDSGVNTAPHEEAGTKEVEQRQELVSEPSGEQQETVTRPQERPRSDIGAGTTQGDNESEFNIEDEPASEGTELPGPDLEPGDIEPPQEGAASPSGEGDGGESVSDLPSVDELPEEEPLPSEDTGEDDTGEDDAGQGDVDTGSGQDVLPESGEHGTVGKTESSGKSGTQGQSSSGQGKGSSGSTSGGQGSSGQGGKKEQLIPGSQDPSGELLPAREPVYTDADEQYNPAPEGYYESIDIELPRLPDEVEHTHKGEEHEDIPSEEPEQEKEPTVKIQDWEMPVVTPGASVVPGVYSVTFSLTVHDPANVILNGITYEVEKKNPDGSWSLFNRKSYSDMRNDMEAIYIFPSLEPETSYRMRGFFKYRDKYGKTVSEPVVFFDWTEFSTKPVSELGDLILEDMELESAVLSGNEISIPHLKFSQESDKDAVGSISKITVRFTKQGTEHDLNPDTKACVLNQNAVNQLKSMQSMAYSSKSGRITLDRGTTYIVYVVCEDRYGTEIEIKNNSGISRTCNMLPTADVKVVNNEISGSEITQTVSFSISNPDNLALENYKFEVVDNAGKKVQINGQTAVSLDPGQEYLITTLKTGRNYTVQVYADCDNNDGQGNISRLLGSRSFVSSSLSSLGPVYLTVTNITSKLHSTQLNERAVFDVSINKKLMGDDPKILQHVDRMEIAFQSDDSSNLISLTDDELEKLLAGDSIILDTDNYKDEGLTIKSKTRYRLGFSAQKIYDAEAGETESIKVISSLTSFATQITPHITNAEVTAMTGYLSVKAQIKDVDDYIIGDTALIRIYKQGNRGLELVSVLRIDKNTEKPVTVKLTSDPERSSDGQSYNIEPDTQYVVQVVAEEAETEKGYKTNYVLLEVNDESSRTEPAISGNIYFGGLKDERKVDSVSGTELYNATLYMDLLDPINYPPENKVKKVYVDEYRVTDIGREFVKPFTFEYDSETFATTPGWENENGEFYSNAYAQQHPEEFNSQLPAGYTRLDYIETRANSGSRNGSGYINTRLHANEGDILSIRYQATALQEQWIAGNAVSGMLVKINGNGVPNTSYAKHFNTNAGQVDIAVATATQGDSNSIYLFAVNDKGSSSDLAVMRLYDAAISNGEELIANYVPCINPSGEIGLYDLVASPERAFVKGIGTFYPGHEIALSMGSEPEEIEEEPLPYLGEIPEGYIQVEYLHSDGSAYIQTGKYANLNTRFEGKFRLDSTLEPYGHWYEVAGYNKGDSSANACTIRAGYNTSFAGSQFWFMGCTKGSGSVDPTIQAGEDTEFFMSSEKLVVNGASYTWSKECSSTESPYTITIFRCNPSGKTWGTAAQRWYYARLYDGQNLVMNLVPVYKISTGEYGMYDTVSGTFKGDAASAGGFSGPAVHVVPDVSGLPAEYEQVEYIHNEGSCAIDTGVTTNKNTKVEMVYELDPLAFQGRYSYLIGVRNWSSTQKTYTHNFNFVINNDNGFVYSFVRNSSSSNGKATVAGEKQRVLLTETKTTVYRNGSASYSAMSINSSGNYASTTLGLFALHQYDSATQKVNFTAYTKAKVYSCRIWNGSTLLRDYVPVLEKASGKYGLYDLENGVFYGNSGNQEQSFSGPAENAGVGLSDRFIQVDYLHNPGNCAIDTGIMVNPSTSVELVYAPDAKGSQGTYAYMLGSRNRNSTNASYSSYHSFVINSNGTYKNLFIRNSSSINGAAVLWNTKQRVLMGMKGTYVYQMNGSINSSMTTTASGGYAYCTLGIFGLHQYDTATGNITFTANTKARVYSCKIYDGNVLVRDFIPVFDLLTGRYGLYDRVYGKFYGDAINNGGLLDGGCEQIGIYTRTQDRKSFTVDVLRDPRISDSYEFSMYYKLNEGTEDEIVIPVSSTSFTTECEVDTIASGAEFLAKGVNNRKYIVINDISLDNSNGSAYMMEEFKAQVDFQGFAFDYAVNNYGIVDKIAAGSSIANAVFRQYIPLKRVPFSTDYKAYPTYSSESNDACVFARLHYGTFRNLKLELTQEQYPYLYEGGQYWSDLSPSEIDGLKTKIAEQTRLQEEGTLLLEEGEMLASEQLAASRYKTARYIGLTGDMYGTVENFVVECKTPLMAYAVVSSLGFDMQAGAVVQNGYIYGSFNNTYTAEFTLLSAANITNISANKSAGGVVGYITGKGALIQNVYSLVDISYKRSGTETFNCMGGIVGWNKGSGATVRNCYVVGDTVQEATGKPASSNYGPAVGVNDSGTVQNVYFLSDYPYNGSSNTFNTATTLFQLRNITWQTSILNSDAKNKRFNVDAAVKVFCYPQLSYTSNVMPAQQMIPLPSFSISDSAWDVIFAYTYENDPLNPRNDVLMQHVSLDGNGNPSKLDWNDPQADISSNEQVICVMIADKSARQVWSITMEGFDIKHEDILADVKDGEGISMVYVRLHDPKVCKTNYRITGVTFADDSGNATEENVLQDARYAYVEYYKLIDSADEVNGWTTFRNEPQHIDGGTCEENLALVKTIDLSGQAFDDLSWCKITYTGKVNGNGYTIKNIDYDDELGKKLELSTTKARQDYMYMGLFGKFNGDAYDLTIENASIETGECTGVFAGSLNAANVENVYIKDSYASGGRITGGLSAFAAQSNIFNCGVSSTKVVNTGNGETNGGSSETDNHSTYMIFGAGGFIGRVDNFNDIVRCYAGDMYVEAQGGFMAGGFIGYNLPGNPNTNIRGCYSSGELVSMNDFTGGFMGYNASAITIDSCYADVDVYVFGSTAGGFMGGNSTGSYSNLVSFGNVASMKLCNPKDDEVTLYSLQALCGKTKGTVSGCVSGDAQILMSTAGQGIINRMGTAEYMKGAKALTYEEYVKGDVFEYISDEYFSTGETTLGMLPLAVDENREPLPYQNREYSGLKSSAADISISSVNAGQESGKNTFYVEVKIIHDPEIEITGAETDFAFVDEGTNRMSQGRHLGLPSFTAAPSFSVGHIETGYGSSSGKRVTTLYLKDMTLERARDTYWLVGIRYKVEGDTKEHFMRAGERLNIAQQWTSINKYSDWQERVMSSHFENFKLYGDIDFTGKTLSAAFGTANMIINRLVGAKGDTTDYAACLGNNRNYTEDNEYFTLSNIVMEESASRVDQPHGWQTNNSTGFIKAVTGELSKVTFKDVSLNKPYGMCNGIIVRNTGTVSGVRFVNCYFNGRAGASCIQRTRGNLNHIYLENIESRTSQLCLSGVLSSMFESYGYDSALTTVRAKNITMEDKIQADSAHGGLLTYVCSFEIQNYTDQIGQTDNMLIISDVDIQDTVFKGISCRTGLVVARSGGVTLTDVHVNNSAIERTTSNNYGYSGLILGWGSNTNGLTTGFNNCSAENCTVSCPGGNYIGGLAGYFQSSPSSFSNCNIVNVTVKGASYVGGLVGDAYGTTCQNCNVTNSRITGTNTYIGGAFGRAGYSSKTVSDVKVENSVITNTGTGNYTGGVWGGAAGNAEADRNLFVYSTVSSKGDYVGGIGGGVSGDGLKQAYSYVEGSTVFGRSYVGGLVGSGYNVYLYNTVENSTIVGTSMYVGGAIGTVSAYTSANTGYIWYDNGGENAWVKNCRVYGGSRVGGAYGNSSHATATRWGVIVENCDIRGYQYVGGAGSGADNATSNCCTAYVSGCYIGVMDDDTAAKYSIDTTKKAEQMYFGGVFGYAAYADSDMVENSLIYAPDASYVGAIGGRIAAVYSSTRQGAGLISKDCVVIGGEYVGGLFGTIRPEFNADYAKYNGTDDAYRSVIRDSYSNALVYGKDKVAGIAGAYEAESGTVKINNAEIAGVKTLSALVKNVYFTGTLKASNANGTAYGICAHVDVKSDKNQSYTNSRWYMKLQGVASLPAYIRAKNVVPSLDTAALSYLTSDSSMSLLSDTDVYYGLDSGVKMSSIANRTTYLELYSTSELADNFLINILKGPSSNFHYLSIADSGEGAEYTQLEYIESTGTQYIDTGITPTVKTAVDMKVMMTDDTLTNQGLFGSRGTDGSADSTSYNLFWNTSDNKGFRVDWVGNASSKHAGSKNTKYTIMLKAGGAATINGSSYTAATKADCSYPMYILGMNSAGAKNGDDIKFPAKTRVYTTNIYKDGVLVGNYIPAERNSDNKVEVGLYDAVNRKFLVNAGSGTINGGPVVGSENTCYAPVARNDLSTPLFEGNSKTNNTQSPYSGHTLYAVFNQGVYLPGTTQYSNMLAKLEAIAAAAPAMPIGIGPTGLASDANQQKIWNCITMTPDDVDSVLFNVNHTSDDGIFALNLGSSSSEEIITSISYKIEKTVKSTAIESEEVTEPPTLRTFSEADDFSQSLTYNYEDTYTVTLEVTTSSGDKARYAKEFTAEYLRGHENVQIGDLTYEHSGTDVYLVDNGVKTLVASGVSHLYGGGTPYKVSLLKTNGKTVDDISDYDYFALPEGYTRLENIKSSGNAWFNTGVKAHAGLRVRMDAAYGTTTVQQRLFGVSGVSGYISFDCYINGSGYYAYGFQNDTGNWISTGLKANTSRHIYDFDANNRTYKIDENTYTISGNVTSSRTTAYPLTLCASCSAADCSTVGNSAAISLYSAQIWDSGNMIRDYVPCKDGNGKVGLYDRISETFFTNLGTGTFAAGPQIVEMTAGEHKYKLWGNTLYIDGEFAAAGIASLTQDSTTGEIEVSRIKSDELISLSSLAYNSLPTGYTRLENIKSSGNAWFNTGVKAHAGLRVQMDAAYGTTTVQQRLFGVSGVSGYISFDCYINGSGYYAYGFQNDKGNWISTGLKANTSRHTYDFDANNRTYKIDTNQYTISGEVFSGRTTAYPLTLCASCGKEDASTVSNSAVITVYSARIWDYSDLVREYVPCKDAGGKAGLYDLVSETFFTNLGTGTFTAGPAVTGD